MGGGGSGRPFGEYQEASAAAFSQPIPYHTSAAALLVVSYSITFYHITQYCATSYLTISVYNTWS